jgi:uncharacterized membrane protein YgdD (TMEM256/DUF423 family)
MSSRWICTAGLSGAVAVLLGAFGAHLLKHWLPLQVMSIFETAVRYHFVHTLALLGTALAMERFPGRERGLRLAAGLFLAGIVLFSGSLYVLSFTDWAPAAWITPLGGLAWVGAWAALAWSFRPGARA